MADIVIVVGATRGNQRVPASEISQMIGRAGRKHDGGECLVTLVVQEPNAEQLMSDMEKADSHVVSSTFGDKQVLAFHLLPEICSGHVQGVEDAKCWYSRSLGSIQGVVPDFAAVFSLLESTQAVSFLNGKHTATDVGKIACRFYFDSSDVCAWKNSFTEIFDLGLECDDIAIAWAMAVAPCMKISGDFGNHWEVVQKYKDGLPAGLSAAESSIVTGTLWWNLLGGPSVGKMKNHSLMLRGDVGRVVRALMELDARVTHWHMTDFFSDFLQRAKRGIPASLASLCRLPGITKSRASYLHSAGIIDKEGIRDSIGQLKGEVDDSFFAALEGIADGVC